MCYRVVDIPKLTQENIHYGEKSFAYSTKIDQGESRSAEMIASNAKSMEMMSRYF